VTGIDIGPSGDADFPLVTIVTPSYNQGRFIAATIESVLSQGYPNLEYLIIDGASTDETAEVVARYGDHVRFISEPDRGQSDAINKGFRLARGEIVAWLNSDDIFLPGAIHAAVDALRARPDVGAVYGDGFQIDEHGATISRFAPTQHFDLWRLLNLSDYILQQTVFFRRAVFDDVGWIDEDLHYGMDWEILIRIGLRWPLLYIPHEMGAIREYATAKSFAGGARRAHELTRMLRRATGKRFPPGMVVYGLPAYEQIVNTWIDRVFRERWAWIVPRLQRRVTVLAHRIVGIVLREAQGLYADGWITKRSRFAFPVPRNRDLILKIEVPSWAPFDKQEIRVFSGRTLLESHRLGPGEHTIRIRPPQALAESTVHIRLHAQYAFQPSALSRRNSDHRLLCAIVRSFELEPPDTPPTSRMPSGAPGQWAIKDA